MKRIPGFLQRSRYAVCYFRGYYSEIERENTSFTTTVIKNSELKTYPKIRNANSPEFSMSLVVLTKATAEAIIYANSEAF